MYHLALSNKIRLLLLYFIPPMPPLPLLLSEQCDKSLDHFYKGCKLNLWFGHDVQWGVMGWRRLRGVAKSSAGGQNVGDFPFSRRKVSIHVCSARDRSPLCSCCRVFYVQIEENVCYISDACSFILSPVKIPSCAKFTLPLLSQRALVRFLWLKDTPG